MAMDISHHRCLSRTMIQYKCQVRVNTLKDELSYGLVEVKFQYYSRRLNEGAKIETNFSHSQHQQQVTSQKASTSIQGLMDLNGLSGRTLN
jgi:hypothetical protein